MVNYFNVELIAERDNQRIQFYVAGDVRNHSTLHNDLFIFDEDNQVISNATEDRNPIHIWNKVFQENGFTTRIIAEDLRKKFDHGNKTLEWSYYCSGHLSVLPRFDEEEDDKYYNFKDDGGFNFKGFDEIPHRLFEKLIAVSPRGTVFEIFDKYNDDGYEMKFQDWYAWTDEERAQHPELK